MSNKNPVKVTVRKNNWAKILKNLYKFSRKDLLVGVPQAKTERDENEGITNAELMFIHTKGSPIKNIPPRPTIEPTIEEEKERISKDFATALKGVLSGNTDGKKELEKIGIYTVNKIKAKFGSEDLAPNAPSTIKAKGSDKPLIDTGQLRNAVTYVIRNK